MGAVSPVAAYGPTNCTTQTGSAYKNQIDSNSVAAQRIVTRFAPHAAATPNMTVLVDAGSIFDGITLTEMPQQTTPVFTAPVNYKRIDRIVLDNVTGAILVVGGQEATAAVPPAIPNGKSPIAQVALAVGVTAIANTMITDERNFGSLAPASFGAQASFGSAATCDLGVALSRNVLITGTTTITSFAASANTQSPIYLIEFAASLTLKNGASLLLPGGGDVTTAGGDTAMAEYLGTGNWRVRTYTRASGKPLFSGAPTRQYLLDNTSSTYTTPTGCTAIVVKMAGGGGGGATAAAGAAGGTTTFGMVSANGGGAATGTAGGAGGTGGSGTASLRLSGQAGDGPRPWCGGVGGSTPFFGGGGSSSTASGGAGTPNTGGGGQGSGTGSSSLGSRGGGSGEYAEVTIPNPAATYNYAIGPGGSAGAANAGAGGSGIIIVEEYYG